METRVESFYSTFGFPDSHVDGSSLKWFSMETQFYIELTLKTPAGLESFAKFYVGNNRERAFDIFRMLKGSDEANEHSILFIDFMETRAGLPFNLKMLACTLDELAENCRLITRELFKSANLELES